MNNLVLCFVIGDAGKRGAMLKVRQQVAFAEPPLPAYLKALDVALCQPSVERGFAGSYFCIFPLIPVTELPG